MTVTCLTAGLDSALWGGGKQQVHALGGRGGFLIPVHQGLDVIRGACAQISVLLVGQQVARCSRRYLLEQGSRRGHGDEREEGAGGALVLRCRRAALLLLMMMLMLLLLAALRHLFGQCR